MDAPGVAHRERGRRLRRFTATMALLLLGLAISAAPPVEAEATGPPQVARLAGPGQAEPGVPDGARYLEPVFDDVTITRDITYRETVDSQGNPVTLRLDIYEPAGDTAARRPVMLTMSGGFLQFIDKTLLLGAGEAYARMGYVVVSIEYRVRPEMDMSGFPDEFDEEELTAAGLDAYDDALAAVDWLRDHAADYRVDPRAIVASGGSAGGSIAWNLAWLQRSEVRPAPSGIAAAVSVAGAPLPIATPSPDDAPLIAFHGTADSVIPFAWAQEPCNAAAEQGARCDLVTYEGAGHPLVDPNPLVEVHGDDIRRRTVDFVAEVVLGPLGYLDEAPDPGAPAPVDPGPAPPATPIPGEPTFTG